MQNVITLDDTNGAIMDDAYEEDYKNDFFNSILIMVCVYQHSLYRTHHRYFSSFLICISRGKFLLMSSIPSSVMANRMMFLIFLVVPRDILV